MSGMVSVVSHGVDTLILNVRYCDEQFHPVKQELAEELVRILDGLQVVARQHDEAVASPWSFLGVALFVEPHGGGKQWRWLVHPAWTVVQAAFAEDLEIDLGSLVRKRIREKNLERGIASTIGYTRRWRRGLVGHMSHRKVMSPWCSIGWLRRGLSTWRRDNGTLYRRCARSKSAMVIHSLRMIRRSLHDNRNSTTLVTHGKASSQNA